MYKLYSNRGNVIVSENNKILFMCPYNICRTQIINNNIRIFEISNREISNNNRILEVGNYSNIVGIDDLIFNSNEDYYNYFVTLNDYGISNVSNTIGNLSDLVANSDTDNSSIISKFKRLLQSTTTIITSITNGSQKTKVVNSDGSTLIDFATSAKQTTLNDNFGIQSDTSASSDTGTFSFISLFKRLLTKITSINTIIGDGSQISQIIAKRGTVITAHNAISATATSAEIDLGDFNFIDLSASITGTGTWNVNVQGRFNSSGTYMDLYNSAGDQITLGNLSSNLMKQGLKVPRYIQIIATEIVDGATLTIRVQPVILL